jgi:hypothetical protein
MMGMCASRRWADARCASLALSHLSLSLSLSSASLLASNRPYGPLPRAAWNPPQGGRAVVGRSRRFSSPARGVGV